MLVPDLTDLGTTSADGLTWTFKLQPNIKYADGTPISVDDMAYAIKRSFAHDVLRRRPDVPADLLQGRRQVQGPVQGRRTYDGVETQGTDTLIIHLAKKFPDLPYYMTFPMFTPIPQAKDTKQDYQNNPMTTGPYMFDSFTAGSELKLKKNPNWDPNTDPSRHQYLDGFDFKWGQDDVKTQQQVLNSSGPDASAINYGERGRARWCSRSRRQESQLVQGQSPCNIVWQLDSRKIPLEVRKAIATAWPYDPSGRRTVSTRTPPSGPARSCRRAFPVTRSTPRSPASVAPVRVTRPRPSRQLTAAGKVGFEVSWYYDNTKPIPQQVSQVRADALTAAGFKVKAIGVSTADLR